MKLAHTDLRTLTLLTAVALWGGGCGSPQDAISTDGGFQDDAAGSGGRAGSGGVNDAALHDGGGVSDGAGAGGSPGAGGVSGSGGGMGGCTCTGGAPGSGGAGSGGASGSGGIKGSGGAAGSGGTGGTTCGPEPDAAARAKCTGTNPIACHFGGDVGDYEVTVVLGGGTTAGNTYVEAEANRRMLGTVATAAGETKRFSFVVNVRDPEGQPIQAVTDGPLGLDLYFKGTAPQLHGIGYRKLTTTPQHVFVAGDSTVCDQTDVNYAGWGQFLPQHINCPVSVANYADSGESSSSFLGNGNLWGAIKSRLRPGDWVLIQFGHNDKTTSAATLKSNFTTMVNDARAKGASPVLVTPISRIGYTLAQEHVWVVNGQTVNIPQIIRDLGTSLKVPVIDLTVTTWNWEQSLGSGWTAYFALGTDHTHTNQKGADVVSGFVADAIKTQQLGIAASLR